MTDVPENAWTDIELRAIALGEAEADRLRVIPQHLTGGSRAAWRAGFARGWAGLRKGAQVDVPQLHPFQDAWREGHRRGMEVCKAAAEGYKITWDERTYSILIKGRAIWSQEQADAYDDGYRAGSQGFNSSKMPFRYRGPLQSYVTMWLWGQNHGRKGYEPDGSSRPRQVPPLRVAEDVRSRRSGARHPVTPDPPVPPRERTELPYVAEDVRKQGDGNRHPVTTPGRSGPPGGQTPPFMTEGVGHSHGDDRHPVTALEQPVPTPDRKSASGVERQRAYRMRRRSRSIDITEETHALLRQLREMRGVRLDEALQIALRAVMDDGADRSTLPDSAASPPVRPRHAEPAHAKDRSHRFKPSKRAPVTR